MIIDCHTHIFPLNSLSQDLMDWFNRNSKINNFKFDINELICEMDKNTIDKSIVLPIIKENEFVEVNNYFGVIQKKWPDRIICFGTINPNNVKESLVELKRIKYKLNLRGIKLHPTIQQFYPNNEKMFKIYELAEELGLPVLFHSGFGGLNNLPDKFSEPIFLDDVASRFNELRIIIAHGGRFFFNQTAMLLRKHNNVYTEISTNIPKSIEDEKMFHLVLAELLGKIKILNGSLKKVFFGSDTPFRSIKDTLNLLNCIKDSTSSEVNFMTDEINNILNKNLIDNLGHILGIS